jgi:L-threonylcarbamoyladenylate synthase
MKTIIFSKNDLLTEENLKKTANLILESKIVIFPTETVYGLGAHVFREDAIEKIYELKHRPKEKGLIVHIGKIEDVKKVAKDIPDEFYLLAELFFPGPLTIILKKNNKVPSNVTKDSTIAVRMPDCQYTLKLINLVQDPIVGTSANISNNKSPIRADEVMKDFLNKVDVIIDGGECLVKIPSTIISLIDKPYKMIRKGSISEKQIEYALNSKKIFTSD